MTKMFWFNFIAIKFIAKRFNFAIQDLNLLLIIQVILFYSPLNFFKNPNIFKHIIDFNDLIDFLLNYL